MVAYGPPSKLLQRKSNKLDSLVSHDEDGLQSSFCSHYISDKNIFPTSTTWKTLTSSFSWSFFREAEVIKMLLDADVLNYTCLWK